MEAGRDEREKQRRKENTSIGEDVSRLEEDSSEPSTHSSWHRKIGASVQAAQDGRSSKVSHFPVMNSVLVL